MSLTRKLVLAFLLVTIVPMAGVMVVLSLTLRHQAEQLVGARLQDNVSQAAKTIDQFMINCLSDMESLASDPDLMKEVQDPNYNVLPSFTYNRPYFGRVTVTDTQGVIVASSYAPDTGRSLLTLFDNVRDEFDQAVRGSAGSVYISDLGDIPASLRKAAAERALSDGDLTVRLLVAMRDVQGRCIGILFGDLAIGPLRELLKDIVRRTPGDGFAYLMDKQGHVLMSTDPQAKLLQLHPDATTAALKPILTTGGEGFVVYKNGRQRQMMTSCARLWEYGANKAGDWRLVTTAPYNAIMAPVKIALNAAFAVLSVTLVGAACCGLWLARTLARPVLELTTCVKTITGGNLDARVPITSRDEIGVLATAFNQMAIALQQQVAALGKAKEGLEQRVQERTADLTAEITERKKAQAELQDLHRQMLDTSRAAGMAEVATNVLHNVGNVLNSVNVSSTLIDDNMRKSKAVNLGKVVALLDEHGADLGNFLTCDPKGKQLPMYLRQLDEDLTQERESVVTEMETLRKNVDHIKGIVSMQQNYARVSGVMELVPVADLVEDALRLNEGALLRHQVEVAREFEPVPPIHVERHKVLQILVNLIRNAKYALDDGKGPDKRLTIHVGKNGSDAVTISVVDNGVGVPAENLTRIFEHGFTTRKDGHGFGLHSGALAAKELGGLLTVRSDGPGQGATFTLELPCPAAGNSHE